jgi:hypothetical protein
MVVVVVESPLVGRNSGWLAGCTVVRSCIPGGVVGLLPEQQRWNMSPSVVARCNNIGDVLVLLFNDDDDDDADDNDGGVGGGRGEVKEYDSRLTYID